MSELPFMDRIKSTTKKAIRRAKSEDSIFGFLLKMVSTAILSICAIFLVMKTGGQLTAVPLVAIAGIALFSVIVPLYSVLSFIYYFHKYFTESEKVKIEDRLHKATASARLLFERSKNNAAYPIGSAIEIVSSPVIGISLEENGWAPENVILSLHGTFPHEDLSADLVSSVKNDANSLPKFSLIKSPAHFSDSSKKKLILDLDKTEYNYSSGIAGYIKANLNKRAEYVSCDPEERRVPHSLCLHVVCEFSDESLFCLKRHPKADYHRQPDGPRKDLICFSFEEQLDAADFDSLQKETGTFPDAAANWMQRSWCEEVFPLRKTHESSPNLARRIINDNISYNRVWSLFLEEEFGNFSLMAHFKLNITAEEYCKAYREISSELNDSRDNEGIICVFDSDQIVKIIGGNSAHGREILTDDMENEKLFSPYFEINEDNCLMHPTNRYRLLWWGKAKGLI